MTSGDVTGFYAGAHIQTSPSLRKKLLPVNRHDLPASCVLLTINHKRCRQEARTSSLLPSMLPVVFEIATTRLVCAWRIDRAGSQWSHRSGYSDKSEAKKSLFPPAEPVGLPTLSLHSCRTPESAWSFVVDTFVTCRWCCGLVGLQRRANHWTCRDVPVSKILNEQ